MYKKIAYLLLWAIIATIVFMLITWGVFWINANNIVQDRLSELVLLVSEENCLSNDGASNATPMDMFNDLLEASETFWLEFDTNYWSSNLSYKVSDLSGAQKYYSYVTAPQKGSIIRVELTGYLKLPVLFDPNGNQAPIITVPIKKVYITMGMRYYKDK